MVYLNPFLSSLPFSKFKTENCMYLRHKDVETGPNFSYELATFLKYHLPLSPQVTFLKIRRKLHYWKCSEIYKIFMLRRQRKIRRRLWCFFLHFLILRQINLKKEEILSSNVFLLYVYIYIYIFFYILIKVQRRHRNVGLCHFDYLNKHKLERTTKKKNFSIWRFFH